MTSSFKRAGVFIGGDDGFGDAELVSLEGIS